MDPCRCSPPGVACGAEGGIGSTRYNDHGLARPKGCFAAYDGGSIDELSRRPTGRPGYIRPTTTRAIGGTAELALGYSIISAFSAGPGYFKYGLPAGP